MKISQGDTVLVIAGKDKGKKGAVVRVLKDQNRVIVADINMVTKHVKKTQGQAGRKVRVEHSIHASNVMLLDPKSGKRTRVGYTFNEKGRKVRVAKKSGATLERVKLSAEDQKKGVEKAVPGQTPAKRAPFWKKGATAAAADSEGGKAEAGPATSTPGHTRSAGRGS